MNEYQSRKMQKKRLKSVFVSGFGILGLDPVKANGCTILQLLHTGGGHCFGLAKTLSQLLLVFGAIVVALSIVGTNRHRVWSIIPLISPGSVVVPFHFSIDWVKEKIRSMSVSKGTNSRVFIAIDVFAFASSYDQKSTKSMG